MVRCAGAGDWGDQPLGGQPIPQFALENLANRAAWQFLCDNQAVEPLRPADLRVGHGKHGVGVNTLAQHDKTNRRFAPFF